MIGVEIFVHAVRMVLNNLPTAIRISAVLMAAQLAVVLLFGTGHLMTGEDVSQRMMQGGFPFFGAFVSFVVIVVTGLWIAVAWHRFILREEVPTGPVPPFDGGAIVAYLVAGIIFGLVLLAVGIPLMLITGVVLGPVFVSASGPLWLLAAGLFALLVYVPVAFVAYRISPILPSAALGQRMALKDAWYATGTAGAGFVVLTVVSVLASWVANLPLAILPGFLAVVWGFLVQWATMLIGASILTTIYGHYVEGRALDA